MGKAVGIDLGTTNSVVAVLEGGEPTVIANAEGNRTTPSIVAFKGQEVLVGELAKRQAITNPTNTIRSIKREIGTNWKETFEGKEYTPQEISARILQKLKRDAESYIGEEVNEAVITLALKLPLASLATTLLAVAATSASTAQVVATEPL